MHSEQARRDVAVQPFPLDVGALFAEHRESIFGYLRRHVPSHDWHLAEDLTEETFIRALERGETFRDRGAPVRAWLFKIAHNLLIDYIRTRKSRPTWSLDALTGLDQEPRITYRFDEIHDREMIADAFTHLTPESERARAR